MKKISSILSATLVLGFFFGFFPFRMTAPTVGGSAVTTSGTHNLNSVSVNIK